MVSRRAVLGGLASLAAWPARAAEPVFVAEPFSLGVASGYPTSSGFTLWTRLAPIPLAPGGGMDPEPVAVVYEVAEDEAFTRVTSRGRRLAIPERAHTVHVDLDGLAPGRWYFYRFVAGDATSPVGRVRTSASPTDAVERLKLGVAGSQHLEHGWYGAHRALADEAPDLVLFLGGYVSATAGTAGPVRRYLGDECRTLDDYRLRYAQHRVDPDLQRLHAAAPWVVVWGEQDVAEDWAGALSGTGDPDFAARRLAAQRAFCEHLPLPRHLRGDAGGPAQVHEALPFGDLVRIHLIDDRSFRSPQACPDEPTGAGGSLVAASSCAALKDGKRTVLGLEQARWLDTTLVAPKPRWNLFAAASSLAPCWPSREAIATDGWDGYPLARKELLATVQKRRAKNPVFLAGDLRAALVADLHADPEDAKTPIVAAQFCAPPLTTRGRPPGEWEAIAHAQEAMVFQDGAARGYLSCELTRDSFEVKIQSVDARLRAAPVVTLATFAVDDGKPGVAWE